MWDVFDDKTGNFVDSFFTEDAANFFDHEDEFWAANDKRIDEAKKKAGYTE